MINWVPGETLEKIEQSAIEQAFRFYRQNKTQTAEALGISIRTLDHKLERYEDDRIKSEIAITSRRSDRQSLLDRQRGQTQSQGSGSNENRELSSSGLRMESAQKVSDEPEMSMPERAKVQEVLSTSTSRRRSGRAR
jgi:hypothetical protein